MVVGEQSLGAAGLGAACVAWGRRLPLPPSPARSLALAEPRLLNLDPSQVPRWPGHAEPPHPVPPVQLELGAASGRDVLLMRPVFGKPPHQVWVYGGGRGLSYQPSASCARHSAQPHPFKC